MIMSAAFHEITIDRDRGLLRVVVGGFLSTEYLARILAEKAAALVDLGMPRNTHLAICDFSECKLQSQDVIAMCKGAIADRRYQARKIVFVIGSSLARMQLRRMMVRDDAAFFETTAEAEAWLFDDNAPRVRQALSQA